MLRELFGPRSIPALLKGGLEETSATHRVIAERVSSALDSSSSTGFSDALKAKTTQGRLTEADLQRDMAALADTQLRYEADAKLLQAAYQRLRSAIHGKSNG